MATLTLAQAQAVKPSLSLAQIQSQAPSAPTGVTGPTPTDGVPVNNDPNLPTPGKASLANLGYNLKKLPGQLLDLGGTVFGGAKAAGEDIASAISAPSAINEATKINDNDVKFINTVIQLRNKARSAGEDTTHWDTILKNYKPQNTTDTINAIAPSLAKSNEQIAGDFVHLGADVLSGGGLSKGASVAAAPAKTILGSVARGALEGAKQGALPGAAYGLAGGLQNNESAGGVAASTAGGAASGAALGGALGGTIGGVSRAVTPKTTAQLADEAQAKTDKAVTTISKQWKAPAEDPAPSFKKVRATLDQSPDAPKFLAQQGIKPSSLVEDGKYVTNETAQSLRDTAGKMSNDTLRPSLKIADYSTPKTDVGDIESAAIASAKRTPSITPGNMEKIIKNIQDEASTLKKQFPEGMSLTDMHDHKITYAQNAGYSPIKDPSVNNSATANRSISSALGKTVEEKAPESVPVKGFNSYLSKYYKAADYLDSLDGKKEPVTMAKALVRGAAKYTGAAVGAHLGGDVVSTFAGYQIGKALEHALENMAPETRSTFIRNLQVTNPEAFTRVQEYLNKATTGNTGVPLLKAATSNSPIPLGAAKDTTPVAPFAAKAPYPLPRDPKTGRVLRTYTSAPETKK